MTKHSNKILGQMYKTTYNEEVLKAGYTFLEAVSLKQHFAVWESMKWPLAGCVTLGKSLPLSELQSPHLQNGNNNSLFNDSACPSVICFICYYSFYPSISMR